jgi:hypothetical protein
MDTGSGRGAHPGHNDPDDGVAGKLIGPYDAGFEKTQDNIGEQNKGGGKNPHRNDRILKDGQDLIY